MYGILVLVAAAVFMYRLAIYEEMDTPILWAFMSIIAGLSADYFLDLGWLSLIGSQLLLVVGIVVRKIFIGRRQANY